MAKGTGFADKIAKQQARKFPVCPTCGGDRVPVKVVRSVRGAHRNTWQFRSQVIKVCKCNEKDVWG